MSTLQVAPDRSLQQRMEALDRANAVRLYRAQLKREIATGARRVGAVLAAPEPQVEMMKVYDVLLAVPKVGRVKAGKWLARCGISPSKTLGGLTVRQRDELLAMVSGRASQSRPRFVR